MLNKGFGYRELGSNISREVFAGVSTFLALSYIFVVNPAILSAAGMDKSAVFFATIVGSVVTTLAMGIWANKPFAVAPGLEMNAFIAYVVVGSLGFTWQGALGAVFWSGLLTVILSFTSFRENVVKSIPNFLKVAISVSVGAFLVLIALKVSGVLVYEGIRPQGLGNLFSKEALVLFFGFIVVVLLNKMKFKASVLVSIVLSSILAWFLGLSSETEPVRLNGNLFSAFGSLDLAIIFNPKVWGTVIVLFVLDFYGSIAKFIGLTRNTNIVDKDGNLPKLKEAMVVDGAGTLVGSITGTSNLITYVESAVGIGAGGRTGLVAVVCGLLMLSFVFLAPLVSLVPVIATTGAILYVGLTIVPLKELRKLELLQKSIIVLMILTTFLTFGLDKAMLVGFVSLILASVIFRKLSEVNRYVWLSTVLLLISVILS